MTGCTYHTAHQTDEEATQEKENIQLAVKYLAINKPVKAISRLKKLLSRYPDSSEAYGLLGVIYQQQGEFMLSEKNFKKALQLNPETSKIRNNYGAMLYATKRFKEAAQQFHLAAQDPYYENRDRSFENLGETYLNIGNTQKAIDYYKHVLRLNNKRSGVRLKLVKVFLQENNLPEAEQYYKDLLPEENESASSLWLGIQLAYKMNHTHKLTEYGNKLSQLHAHSPEYREYQNLIK